MIVATWNVNGIRARATEVAAWIERERPDVLCLQETKASPEQVASALPDPPEYACFWHGKKGGYSGVGLLVRRAAFATPPELRHPPHDSETRIVQCDLGALAVASVYMPNGGKDYPAKIAFMKAMTSYVEELHGQGRQVILCGDMNVARTPADVHPSQRDETVIGQTAEERALFEEMIGHGLVDVGRSTAPDSDRLFTWWPYWRNARARNLGWRLDYVLASASLGKCATSCVVQADYGTSDHAPVIANFAVAG